MISENVENSLTETNKFHITPAREKILEALLNPEYMGLSTTEKCNRIGVSRNCWYDAIRDPDFMEMVTKTSVDLVKDKVADVLAASVKCATGSGARGYQDRRMLLEMFGIVVKDNDSKITIINVKD